jgi:hypothetical protein
VAAAPQDAALPAPTTAPKAGAPVTVELEAALSVLPEIPGLRPKYQAALAEKVKPLAVLRASPAGTRFAQPGMLTVKIDPSAMPPGKTLADVVAVSIDGDTIED